MKSRLTISPFSVRIQAEILSDLRRRIHNTRFSSRGQSTDESFRQALARARERRAEVWAEEMLSISDDELPTHEAIGRARLRMQSRQWLAGKYNPQFADKPNQTQVNVGVQVVLPEAERVKLLER
jgi:hypothetical protein